MNTYPLAGAQNLMRTEDLNDNQDLTDLKHALVAHYEGERQKLINDALHKMSSLEQDLIREKEAALTKMKHQMYEEKKALAALEQQKKEEHDKELSDIIADRDHYKELDAQTTKRMLDTVNPVLCWVRLRGPREHGVVPAPYHDTKDYSARMDTSISASLGPQIYHTQHRTRLRFHPGAVKNNHQWTETAKEWPFDRIFLESETTKALWNELSHLIRSAMNESRHALIFAYGQTGTGKSSTMISDIKGSDNPDTQPILFRTLDFIYDKRNGDFVVEVMVLQQYKMSITDLSVELARPNDESANIELTRGHADLDLTSRLKYAKRRHTPVKFQVHSTILAAKKHVREALNRRKRDSTPQNECSSRSHTFVFLRIKDCTTDGHRGLITLVDLAGQENHPILSDDAGRKVKNNQDMAIHSSITKSLGNFKGFMKCFASAESRAAGSETPKQLHQYNHPLTDVIRLVALVSSGRPLPSIVIIAHVSTVRRDLAESKTTLEWLHNCRPDNSDVTLRVPAGTRAGVKHMEQLLDNAQLAAQKWEALARECIDHDICEELARELGDATKEDKGERC